MKLSFRPLALLALTALAGCSSNQIIIDTKGVDMTAYQSDLAECETYAEQVNTGKTTAKRGAVGAAAGGAMGAIIGNSEDAAAGAGVGAVAGVVKGARAGKHEKQQVVKRCLSGRGYRVLN